MTIESKTKLINTKGEYVTISSLTGITFTANKKYLIETNALTHVKVLDAEVEVYDQKPYQYCAGSNDIYIKTDFCGCKLTVLEVEE